MRDFDVLLFDVGGVLVELAGISRLLEWVGTGIDSQKLNLMWGCSKAVRIFETGNSTSIEFSKALVDELKLSVSSEQFIEEFACFTKGLYIGAKELLDEVSKYYCIASFSNTNYLQWNRLCKEYQINNLFHKIFLSYEIGLMKPDKAAYLHVIKELGCKPNRIAFFDDNQLNVDMGNEVGMRAYKVAGINELMGKINELNILSEIAI